LIQAGFNVLVEIYLRVTRSRTSDRQCTSQRKNKKKNKR